MRYTFGLSLLAIMTSTLATVCAANPLDQPNKSQGSHISISHSGSRGSQRAYEITLFPDGTAHYKGFAHVKTLGPATTQIEARQYRDFVRALDRIGFFGMGVMECPEAMDISTTTISVTDKNRKSTISYNWPCKSIGALPIIVQKIETAVNVEQWFR